jgi:hypothetical protein
MNSKSLDVSEIDYELLGSKIALRLALENINNNKNVEHLETYDTNIKVPLQIQNDIRNLSRWLNEQQISEIDRRALARVLAHFSLNTILIELSE